MAESTDVYVGKRIRHRRWLIRMTQKELAERVGVKFQQIQKYETGRNRVSASMLWEISIALRVPVAYFFEGIGLNTNELETILGDINAALLVASYYKIPIHKRKAIFDLASALASNDAQSS